MIEQFEEILLLLRCAHEAITVRLQNATTETERQEASYAVMSTLKNAEEKLQLFRDRLESVRKVLQELDSLIRRSS